VSVRERALNWDGCVNVRDLGGQPREDGGTTAFGRVVRADSARQLSDAGWSAAAAYGIQTVLDLRFREELEADPPGEIPVDVVHLSVFEELDPEYWAELDGRAAATGDDVAATTLVYLEQLERHRGQVAAAIGIVADAPGGVLVHCTGGKDRTGLISALLLRLAGVGLDSIGADYALSEVNLADRRARWLEQAPDDAERERLRRISVTPAAAMVAVIEELERRYGSVEAYLRAGGAADGVVQRARARLRD
jgi:protein tyrosine/serine phosphatase